VTDELRHEYLYEFEVVDAPDGEPVIVARSPDAERLIEEFELEDDG
jgi:hypothetical protein